MVGSEVESFFQSSPTFSRVWTIMNRREGSDPDVIYTPLQTVTPDKVGDVGEGVARVRNGQTPNYVFIWHTPGIRYLISLLAHPRHQVFNGTCIQINFN